MQGIRSLHFSVPGRNAGWPPTNPTHPHTWMGLKALRTQIRKGRNVATRGRWKNLGAVIPTPRSHQGALSLGLQVTRRLGESSGFSFSKKGVCGQIHVSVSETNSYVSVFCSQAEPRSTVPIALGTEKELLEFAPKHHNL